MMTLKVDYLRIVVFAFLFFLFNSLHANDTSPALVKHGINHNNPINYKRAIIKVGGKHPQAETFWIRQTSQRHFNLITLSHERAKNLTRNSHLSESQLRALINASDEQMIYEDKILTPQLSTVNHLTGAHVMADHGYQGSGVTIAVIDTGVERDHPFLQDAIVAEACFSTNDDDYESLCPNGVESSEAYSSAKPCTHHINCKHGTHVAGILAGRKNVYPDLQGVAPQANLFPIQVYSKCRSGSCIGAFTSDILRALNHVLERREELNIVAVNISLNDKSFYSDNCESPLEPVIQELRHKGVAVVISTGNDGLTNQIAFPACTRGAIPVTATDAAGSILSRSNISPMVKFSAPGAGVFSSVLNGNYGMLSGTSMAAPQVAATFAIYKSMLHQLSVNEIERALVKTSISQPSGATTTPVNSFHSLVYLPKPQNSQSPILVANLSNLSAHQCAWKDIYSEQFYGNSVIDRLLHCAGGHKLMIQELNLNSRQLFISLDDDYYLYSNAQGEIEVFRD
ncbi:MAG: S8 family peptidase [Cellvibrio sp.]